MKKDIRCIHKVHYYETDQMKVVHHSNYIKWFENARLDFFEQNGISYAQMEKDGIIIPVVSVDCQYKKMTHFGDTVVIIPVVKQFNGVVIEFSYEVRDLETNELRVTGNSSHCFLNSDYKVMALQKTFPEVYEKIKNAV